MLDTNRSKLVVLLEVVYWRPLIVKAGRTSLRPISKICKAVYADSVSYFAESVGRFYGVRMGTQTNK